MPHITEKFQAGPITFNCGTNTIIGGRLVMPDSTTGFIKHTTGAVTSCLGVAIDDANPSTAQTVDGYNVTAAIIRPDVSVANSGVYRLTCSTAIPFGAFVIAAASGFVAPYVAGTTTFDQIIGKCVEPAGILINARGMVLVDIV